MGQLQFEQAEHGKRQNGEERGQNADRDGRLQNELEVLSGPTGGSAQKREGRGERDHIDRGELEATPGGEPVALARQRAGHDGIHGKDARGEGEKQAEKREADENEQNAAATEQRQNEPVIFGKREACVFTGRGGNGGCGGRRFFRDPFHGRCGLQGRRRADGERKGVYLPVFRCVADAAILTALKGDVECAEDLFGKMCARLIVIDFGEAECGVVLADAGAGFEREFRAVLRCADVIAIKVIAFGDLPVEGKRAVLRARHL